MKRLTLLSLVTVSSLCISNYAYAQEDTGLEPVPMGIDYTLGSTDIRQPFSESVTSLDFFFTLNGEYASGVKEDVKLTILNGLGKSAKTAKVTAVYDDNAWKFKFQISWTSAIKYPGTFTITIPEGTFYNATYQNEETELTFTQVIPLEASAVSPKNTVELDISTGENLNSVRVTYPIKPTTVEEGPKPYIVKPDGSRVTAYDFSPSVSSSSGYMFAEFTETEKFASGEYTFVVPAGACEIVGGYKNVEQSFVYNVVGDPRYDVQDYTLTSARLVQNGESYNLLELGNSFAKLVRDADLYFTLAQCSADEVSFKIVDVTKCEEGDLTAYNNAEGVYVSFANLSNGEYYKSIYAIGAGYTLYEDHKYCLLIQDNFYQPVSASAIFMGTTPTYKYSDVNIVSITPAPGSIFTINDTMTVKFSAPVKIVTGDGKTGFSKGTDGWASMVSISKNEDMTEYSFMFPEEAFLGISGENCVDAILCATDMDGRYFHPSFLGEYIDGSPTYWSGVQAGTRLHILYSSYYDTADVTVSPLEAEEISELTFEAGGLDIAPSWFANRANILNADNEIVSQVICDNFVANGGNITGVGSANGYTAIKIKLTEPLIELGEYTLELPYNMFTVGKENDAKASSAALVKIVVGKDTGVEELVSASEGETIYYNLQGQKIENPFRGIFIKVMNGKVEKVIL